MTRTMTSPTCWLLACLGSGCGGDTTAAEEPGQTVVYTTFYPTTYFTRRIAGDAVEVVCPLPEDADPIFWRPPRAVIARYQAASLIVVNGAEFEKWVGQVSLPTSRVVDTARSFADDFISYESTTHSHGAGGQHTHEGIDGHTWLDPELAKRQARAIRAALERRFPEHAAAFAAGSEALEADLDRLDARLGALGLEGVTLLCSHPAYNYLARRHAWPVRNFDLDPSEPLPEGALASLREAAGGGGRVLMLWESEPCVAAVEGLRELGIDSVLFSPCETLGAQEQADGADYLSVMGDNVDRLEAALGGR